MAFIDQVYRDTVSFLNANIVDVRTPARANWIRIAWPFTGLLTTDLSLSGGVSAVTTAQVYPIITIFERRTALDWVPIGEEANSPFLTGKIDSYVTELQADVWVQRGDAFVVGAQTMSDMLLVTYLSDQIEQTVNDKRATFIGSTGYFDIFIRSSQPPSFDEKTQLFRKTVIIELNFIRKR